MATVIRLDDSKNAPFDRLTVPNKFVVAAGEENEFAIELTPEMVRRFGSKPER